MCNNKTKIIIVLSLSILLVVLGLSMEKKYITNNLTSERNMSLNSNSSNTEATLSKNMQEVAEQINSTIIATFKNDKIILFKDIIEEYVSRLSNKNNSIELALLDIGGDSNPELFVRLSNSEKKTTTVYEYCDGSVHEILRFAFCTLYKKANCLVSKYENLGCEKITEYIVNKGELVDKQIMSTNDKSSQINKKNIYYVFNGKHINQIDYKIKRDNYLKSCKQITFYEVG